MKKENYILVAEYSENDYDFLKSFFKYVAVSNMGLGDRLIGFSNVPKCEHDFIKFFEFEEVKDLFKLNTQYLFNVRDSELPELIKHFRLTLMGKETRDSEEEIIGFTNSLEIDFRIMLVGLKQLPEQVWVIDNETGKRLDP